MKIVALLALAGVGLYLLGVGCPVRFSTGVPCPGCGLTRAWLAFLRGDVASALAYHPLFWTVPFVVAAMAWRLSSRPAGGAAGAGEGVDAGVGAVTAASVVSDASDPTSDANAGGDAGSNGRANGWSVEAGNNDRGYADATANEPTSDKVASVDVGGCAKEALSAKHERSAYPGGRGRALVPFGRRALLVLGAVLILGFMGLWICRLLDPSDGGLLFGGVTPAGVPTDIIHLQKPFLVTLIQTLL